MILPWEAGSCMAPTALHFSLRVGECKDGLPVRSYLQGKPTPTSDENRMLMKALMNFSVSARHQPRCILLERGGHGPKCALPGRGLGRLRRQIREGDRQLEVEI